MKLLVFILAMIAVVLSLPSCKKHSLTYEEGLTGKFNRLVVPNTFYLSAFYDGSVGERWQQVNPNVKKDVFHFIRPYDVTVMRGTGEVMQLHYTLHEESSRLHIDFYDDKYQPLTYKVEEIGNTHFILSVMYEGKIVYSKYTLLY